jgi:heme/copper-type cytochrome/quinol oxidase subunit 4
MLGQLEKMRRGLVVITILAVLTAIEFVVAVSVDTGRFGLLAVFALIKAWLILDYFMHISQLWKSDEE